MLFHTCRSTSHASGINDLLKSVFSSFFFFILFLRQECVSCERLDRIISGSIQCFVVLAFVSLCWFFSRFTAYLGYCLFELLRRLFYSPQPDTGFFFNFKEYEGMRREYIFVDRRYVAKESSLLCDVPDCLSFVYFVDYGD